MATLPRAALSDLAVAMFCILVIALTTALLVALVLQGLYDLGLRQFLQRRWVRMWLQRLEVGDIEGAHGNWRQRTRHVNWWLRWLQRKRLIRAGIAEYAMAEIERHHHTGTAFALPPPQLTGQISALLNLELEKGTTSALVALATGEPQSSNKLTDSGDPALKMNFRRANAERSLDNLHIFLTRRSVVVDYCVSLYLALIVLGFAAFAGSTLVADVPISLFTFMILCSVILVPQMRAVTERLGQRRS
jgi:hypothetical protein